MVRFNVRFKELKRIDERTFEVEAAFDDVSSSTFIRMYEDAELAAYVHNFTRRVDSSYVAKSKYIDSHGDGARVFFPPFYPHSFDEWVDIMVKQKGNAQLQKLKKGLRSVVLAMETLHNHKRFEIGLQNAIRFNDDDNCQIVLDTKGTRSIVKGGRTDIVDFVNLVYIAFKKIHKTRFDAGYKFFCKLHRHFSKRPNNFSNDAMLRSHLYFICHNPLIYDVEDRSSCLYKLTMFRDMDSILFDSLMGKIMEISNWRITVQAKVNGFLKEIYEPKKDSYLTDSAILMLFSNCQGHGQGQGNGIYQVQEIWDYYFPIAIYALFYYFVERIEVHHMYKNVHVLEYFSQVHPSPSFRR